MLSILVFSVLPSILLTAYIYRLDHLEKEPMDLIKRLFFLGAASTLFAMVLETAGSLLLDRLALDKSGILYNALFYFLVVAVSEELVKYVPLRKTTWYHPAFNCRFDAVVYAVAVTLGFAAAENIMYVAGFGITVAPIRALFAVPMHGICGLYMGYEMGQAKYCEATRRWDGMVFHNVLSFVIPVALHGYYDFCQSVDNPLLSGSFFIFVVVLDVIAYRSLHRYAREDVTFARDPYAW